MVTAEGPMPELKVGDMLEAIPVHICPTVNLQNQIYVAGRRRAAHGDRGGQAASCNNLGRVYKPRGLYYYGG